MSIGGSQVHAESVPFPMMVISQMLVHAAHETSGQTYVVKFLPPVEGIDAVATFNKLSGD
jgi:hypothetical protein